MSAPTAIVVLAPNWLGDAVMALPSIADVQRAFPMARLVVAARPAVADLFRLVPGIAEVVTFAWRGRLLQRRGLREDGERLRATGARVALLLPNSFAAAWLAKQAGIAERWGYASDLRSPLLTRAVPRPRGSRHQGAYYQHLTRALGVSSGPLTPRLDVPAAAREAAHALLTRRGWDGVSPLAVLAPGAAYGTAKRWLPARVSSLAALLAGDRRFTCALVGSAADRTTTTMVREGVPAALRGRVIDVAGETTLDVLAGILALGAVVVSNDSGAMHVAAAIGTPVAAVFGPTREFETAPLPCDGGRIEVVLQPVWCRPCMLRECPIDHRCMKGVTPERVLGAIDRLLAGGGA